MAKILKLPRSLGASKPPPIVLVDIDAPDEKVVRPNPAVDDESQHTLSRWLDLADGALNEHPIRKTGRSG